MAKYSAICSVEGCGKPWYCRVFCLVHYGAWRRMPVEERAAELAKSKQGPVLTPWSYEGDEAALIEQQEREEKEQ